jgi:hypothetical protein
MRFSEVSHEELKNFLLTKLQRVRRAGDELNKLLRG